MRMARGVLFAALAALLASAAQGQIFGPEIRRPKPTPTPWPNEPPTVKLASSADRVVLSSGCAEAPGAAPACTATSPKITLSAEGKDPDGDTLLYTYTAAAGRLEGDGPEATLDLTGVAPGVYDITLEVDDGNGGVTTETVKVRVERCACTVPPPAPQPCPTVTVSCPDAGGANRPITFTVNVSGGDPRVTPTFNWTVSAGTISSGRGTSSITVDTGGAPAGLLTATVDVGGYDRSCRTSNSCTLPPHDPPVSRKLDEYGDISIDGRKARIGRYAAELQNDPSARGYVICYGGRRGRALEARRRCHQAASYLGNYFRGIDASRVVTVDGGLREQPSVEFWLVPPGAAPPEPTPMLAPRQAGPPTPPRKARRRGRR